tara:strand:+ start:527 stop:1405 length:879 start_codon:yes stop_codon:yes gene_type:complete
MSQDHKITRRTALASVVASAASITIGATALAAAPAAPALPGYASETPEIIAALTELADARAALAKSATDLDWFAAHWGYHWPKAPEEILGGRCMEFESRVETDILGAPVFHVAADLTKRLPRDMRDNRKLCFAIETPAEIREWIATHQAFSVRGRSPETRAKDAHRKARYIASQERKLALSEAYFAERARVLEESGAPQMRQRHADAQRAVVNAFAAVSRAPVASVWGLRAKALAYLADAARHREMLEGLGGVYQSGYALALHTAQTTRPAEGEEWPLIAAALPDALTIAAA